MVYIRQCQDILCLLPPPNQLRVSQDTDSSGSISISRVTRAVMKWNGRVPGNKYYCSVILWEVYAEGQPATHDARRKILTQHYSCGMRHRDDTVVFLRV